MKEHILTLNQVKIPLIYEYSNVLPIVSLRIFFKNAGQVSENKPGLANLLAELLNEGSKKLGSTEFNRALEIKAIELNVSSASESLIVELNCLKEHFNYGLNMLISLLNDPNFTPKILEQIKATTLGKIASKQSDFDYQARLMLNEMLFTNSPFANPKIGYEASINDISLDDLKSFYKQRITLNNAFIVLGGDVRVDELNLSALDLASGAKSDIYAFSTSDACKQKSEQKQSEQAYIYFGAPYNVKSEDRYKANVAMFVLGSSGFGTRLLEEVRVKRGLAYSAYAHPSFSLYRSFLSGYLQTKNENKDAATSLVKQIFKDFVQNGISEAELKAAKNFLLGSEPLSKETLFKRLDIAQNEHYMGYKLGEFDENLKKIAKLSLKDINTFIKEHSEICSLSFATIHGELKDKPAPLPSLESKRAATNKKQSTAKKASPKTSSATKAQNSSLKHTTFVQPSQATKSPKTKASKSPLAKKSATAKTTKATKKPSSTTKTPKKA